MLYAINDVVKAVKVCLDQNTSSEALIADYDLDTLTLDEIVESKVLEAVRRVHNQAPYYLLEHGHNFGDAIYWGNLESGYVLLPDDFQRLVVFEMSDWERPVYTAISTDDPDYEKQRSRFKGIRGTAQNPVCAIGFRPEGKVLEFYSCKSEDAFVSKGVYLPYPKIDDDGYVDICERCYTAVTYTAAALVLTTLGEADKATALNQLAEGLLK